VAIQPHHQKPENKYRIADAFLVKSLGVRIMANFFIKVTKPKVNTRLFTDEKEAIKWLEGLKKAENKLVMV
jgi:hypothetical protein